jgi:4-hydroxybenzoyl-CoA thioesterase
MLERVGLQTNNTWVRDEEMVYRTKWTVRFGDVDAAGIVYYPQLFDRVVRTVEEFLAEMGFPVSQFLDNDIGMPIVNAEVDLIAPIRLGDVLDIELSPTIGDSSVVYDVDFNRQDETVASIRQTMVTIDLDTFDTRPVPPGLVAAFEKF